MTTRAARTARGTVAAAVSLFVALCSHAVAGGGMPGLAGIALCAAFATLVCIALAGRRLSLPRLSVSVVASQFLFHALFSEFTASSGPVVPAMASMHTVTSGAAIHATAHAAMPAWMWVAHAVAAILTIAALRFGEGAFWAVVMLVAPRALRMLVPAVTPSARPARPRHRIRPFRHLAPLSPMRHRGPPALSF
jgi:hypothetical protein